MKNMEIEEKVKELEKKLREIESKLSQLLEKSVPETKDSNPPRRESPREFLLKFRAEGDVKKTLIAIQYLESKNLKEITSDNIKLTLIEMREKSSFNISDKIQQLDRRGFLVPNGQKGKKKLWLISNKGLEFLKEMEENARKK